MGVISLWQKTRKEQMVKDYIRYVHNPIMREFFMIGKLKMTSKLNKNKEK